FTATPTNGGTTPSYQWKVDGTNVGTNSATYTTTTLTNGAVVTCVMTSNATCAVPASATSNSITMSITGGTVTYCSATTTTANATTSFEYIRKVVCGSISKLSNASVYSNYTTLSTSVVRGTTRTFTVTVNNNFTTDQVIIWCDWNNDGDFIDAGENVYTSPLGGAYSGSFVIPTTASLGAVRMRIRLTDTASGANTTPCGVSSYGEVEDYTLNVAAAGTMLEEEEKEEAIVNRANETAVSLESINLNVYPNPNNGSFTIKAMHEGTYYLMNEAGQLVQSFSLNAENQYTHQISNLTVGFYILSGQNREGISKQKIVVTN
ncbi:MAG: GEVED domain-containing protein, partial [Flavobacteriales bacterium]